MNEQCNLYALVEPFVASEDVAPGESFASYAALCAYNVRYTFASEIREQFRIRRWHPTWAIQLF